MSVWVFLLEKPNAMSAITFAFVVSFVPFFGPAMMDCSHSDQDEKNVPGLSSCFPFMGTNKKAFALDCCCAVAVAAFMVALPALCSSHRLCVHAAGGSGGGGQRGGVVNVVGEVCAVDGLGVGRDGLLLL